MRVVKVVGNPDRGGGVSGWQAANDFELILRLSEPGIASVTIQRQPQATFGGFRVQVPDDRHSLLDGLLAALLQLLQRHPPLEPELVPLHRLEKHLDLRFLKRRVGVDGSPDRDELDLSCVVGRDVGVEFLHPLDVPSDVAGLRQADRLEHLRSLGGRARRPRRTLRTPRHGGWSSQMHWRVPLSRCLDSPPAAGISTGNDASTHVSRMGVQRL